jgi:hypothetical protein
MSRLHGFVTECAAARRRHIVISYIYIVPSSHSQPHDRVIMPSYTLVSPTASDIPRIATIQQAAFAKGSLTAAALPDVSKEDYISWCEQSHSHPSPPPGYKLEFVCAKNTDTGEIAGWAQWAIPLADGEEWKGDEKREKVPLPKGTNKMVLKEFFESVQNHESRIMEGRKHWGMSPASCSVS